MNLQEFLKESLGKKCDWIFTVIKPGFLNRAEDIIKLFEQYGWEVMQTRPKKLTLAEAKKLYAVHKKEDFYDALCNYMSSGESLAIKFRKPNCTDVFREADAIKDLVRKKWGESDMRNVLHSSDSFVHMEEESPIYF
jgi:nucleoside diphosphate kinase